MSDHENIQLILLIAKAVLVGAAAVMLSGLVALVCIKLGIWTD